MINFDSKKTSHSLALSGIIAALYFMLTIILYPISFGAVQVRVSELLTLLPLFFKEAILGLTIGCLISNLLGNGIFDIIFGTLATLISAVCTYVIGLKIKNNKLKFALGGIFPVLINAIVVPIILYLVTNEKGVYFFNFITVFLGQFLAIYVIGGAFYFIIIKRLKAFKNK